MIITQAQVLEALSHVEDPDLKKDLVTLKMIENIVINSSKLSFDVVLTTPACPMKAMIENACRNAIIHFVSKDLEVAINMTSRVATTATTNALPGIKNVIAVASGKGGVGKSTVAVNLAVALAQTGAKVGILDADIYGPSVPTLFGLIYAKPKATEIDGKVKIIPIEKYGVKILSIGFLAEPGQPIPWRGPMLTSALRQLFTDASWGEIDYLIVDTPPGTGDVHITLSQQFPISGAVIVTTPQAIAISDTQKGMAMFKMDNINVPILGVIENMAYFTPAELPDNKYYIFGKEGGKKLAQKFDVPFLGELPIVQSISEANDSGIPIALNSADVTGQAFAALAGQVVRQLAMIGMEA